MTELFVSMEIALRLKELGFNEPCFTTYLTHLKVLSNPYNMDTDEFKQLQQPFSMDQLPSIAWCTNTNTVDPAVAAPTLQQVQKWLSEVHNIDADEAAEISESALDRNSINEDNKVMLEVMDCIKKAAACGLRYTYYKKMSEVVRNRNKRK